MIEISVADDNSIDLADPACPQVGQQGERRCIMTALERRTGIVDKDVTFGSHDGRKPLTHVDGGHVEITAPRRVRRDKEYMATSGHTEHSQRPNRGDHER